MALVDALLKRLEAARGDTRAQAAVAAEFVLATQPEPDRAPLRAALDAAAVLRWFDAGLLAALLEVPEAEAAVRFRALEALPFVERYRMGERDLRNLHESTRLGWRRQLFHDDPRRFRALSARAAAHFAEDPTRLGRIEWIYHRLTADPDGGATDLAKLDRAWTSGVRPEDRYALRAAIEELESAGLLEGRARAWVLMVTAWTRASRGETAQLGDTVEEVLRLARDAADRRLEADASGTLGDVLLTQGNLAEAREAFDRYLHLSQALAEEDPADLDAERELLVAYSRVGDVLREQGNLAGAHEAIGRSLDIARSLVKRQPGDPARERELAAALSRLGDVLSALGRRAEARAAFEENLTVVRGFAAGDPTNSTWQRDLAVAHSWMGDVLMLEGQPAEARAAFEESLKISRRVAEQDPTNSAWQRNLAVAMSRMADVLESVEQLPAAQAALAENLAISRRLAEQDPADAYAQRELAVAQGRMGDLLQALSRLSEAQDCFAEGLANSRDLVERDTSNTVWLRDLALAWLRVARLRSSQDKPAAALPLYEEASHTFGALLARAPGFAQWAEEKRSIDGELERCRKRLSDPGPTPPPAVPGGGGGSAP